MPFLDSAPVPPTASKSPPEHGQQTPHPVIERLNRYEQLLRLDKPIGILLLLWPTLGGLWLATQGQPRITTIWLFIVGTILMRSAGCVINDYADRKLDAQVERTRQRPLAAGLIAPWEALVLALVLIFFSAMLLLLVEANAGTWKIAYISVILTIIYPFTKRFLAIPQAFLGIVFSLGIPMTWTIIQYQSPSFGFYPSWIWLLMLANLFWVLAYDTEYAMVDAVDDKKIGIHTSALLLGKYAPTAIMVCYLIFFIILIQIGLQFKFGTWYNLGILISMVLALRQLHLVRDGVPSRCYAAFLQSHWVGAIIFFGIVLDYGLTYHAWPR